MAHILKYIYTIYAIKVCNIYIGYVMYSDYWTTRIYRNATEHVGDDKTIYKNGNDKDVVKVNSVCIYLYTCEISSVPYSIIYYIHTYKKCVVYII